MGSLRPGGMPQRGIGELVRGKYLPAGQHLMFLRLPLATSGLLL